MSLYFIRSHYLPSSNVEPEFVEGNIKTQVVSLECLSNLTWELVKLVRESGHGFGNFITDLLSRCKVQKAIAHCLAATTKPNETDTDTRRECVRVPPDDSRTTTDTSRTPTENSRRTPDTAPDTSRVVTDDSRSVADTSRRSSEETVDQMILQSKLLEVVESLIVLENVLASCFEALTPDHLGNSDFEIIMKGDEVPHAGTTLLESQTFRFVQGKSLSSQEMLLNLVLCSLKARNFDMSSRWTGFVIECLPYLGGDLRVWVVPVVLQMCRNLSDVAVLFKERNTKSGKKDRTW